MKKIYLIGDSLSKSITSKNHRYVKDNFDIVKELENNYSLEIENYSQIGQTLYRIIEKDILKKIYTEKPSNLYEKQYVVIELGGNDCDYYWEQINDDPIANHLPKTPFNSFFEQLTLITKKCRDENLCPVFLLTPPIVAERYFDFLCTKFNKEKLLEFLYYDVTNIYRHQECYMMNILKLAKQLNVKVLDLRTEFLLKKDFNTYICEDGIHPNEKGYKFLYKLIEKNL